VLAAPDGKWLGKGISGLRDNQVLLRVGLRFPRKGAYLFDFEQAMREENLEGISDIGLRIEKE
jgi:gliding motility-associated lipoprotein GldH